MKVINRIIFAFTLLCFLTGCNDKEVNNVEPIDTIVIDNYIEENLPNEDILVDNDYDISSVENQIQTIVECTAKSTVDSIKYYTITDLDNNGRMELLLATGNNTVEAFEVSDDYLSLQDIGSAYIYVSGTGEMTLKRYAIKDEFVYVGYEWFGDYKNIFYIKNGKFTSDTIYCNNNRIFFDDGNNGILFAGDDNYLNESKKSEEEYFVEANNKQLMVLNWHETDQGLDVETLNNIYEDNIIKDFEEMDEWDAICAFTGNRTYRVDKLDLSDNTIELFENCAMYLDPNYDVSNGDFLSSKDYRDIKDFLFFLKCDEVEFVQEFGSDHETRINRISYEDWAYILKEVYGEQNPEQVKNKLNNSRTGEVSVYYVPEDDYIYQEAGMVDLYDFYTQVKGVIKTQEGYIISYNVYSAFTGEYESTIDVTIAYDDNKYGFRLDSIEWVK